MQYCMLGYNSRPGFTLIIYSEGVYLLEEYIYIYIKELHLLIYTGCNRNTYRI